MRRNLFGTRVVAFSIVIVATPLVTATTKDSQMRVSLTVKETCRATIGRGGADVSCLDNTPSKISYGRPFAVLDEPIDAKNQPAQDSIVEIAF
ncbi:hypothetical protein [Caballeronia pedi]|nr:hypothetical protein [Caballeronia pedi]